LRRLWALPLVPLYAAGSWLRWVGVRPKRLAWPVVSVGSISAGGAGKTPFVIALAGLLKEQGVAVDVLSRGYGRSDAGATRVDPMGTAEAFGDEPLLIAREAQAPVFVGARRFEAGLMAEAEQKQERSSAPEGPRISGRLDAGVEAPAYPASHAGQPIGVHLLDDGFQHRQLERDIDVVLVSSEDLEDWLLPAGNRRETLGALRRADVLAVAAGEDAAVGRLRGMGLEQPVWRFRREMVIPEVHGPVVAFCGIARPEQFFTGLERAGVSVVERREFGDHHRFSDEDLAGLREIAARTGAVALATTGKDRVRLGSRVEELGLPVLVVGLRVVIEDEGGAVEWLCAKVGSFANSVGAIPRRPIEP
jgi:tetraacyldisaccharide 4'-kinase